MKRSCTMVTIAVLLLAVLILPGCVELFTGVATEETVKLLTPEDIESIFASITVDVTDEYVPETDDKGNTIVYWLKGGEVWHVSKFCASIAKADDASVNFGTIEEAISGGKKRACKICSDGKEAAEVITVVDDPSDAKAFDDTEEIKITVEINTPVYWLNSGTVWHLDRSCRSLSGYETKAVNIGTISEAYAKGKKRGCKNCASEVEYDISILYTDIPETTESPDIEITEAPEKHIKEYTEDGKLIVFWLEGSKIWHESRQCSSLARSDPAKIRNGCVDEALAAGKERACKNCS